jgi:hypothetical protein
MADWDPELYNRFRRFRAELVDAILARLGLRARREPSTRIAVTA